MIFDEQIARKPDHYPWTQEFIDRIWAGFWTPNEFNFKGDYSQFKTVLTDAERQVIIRTLSAIGQVEIAVKKFWARLGDNLPHPSISDLGFAMANSEVIHNQAYEKLLDRLGLGDVFEENLRVPVVRDRVAYLRKHLDKVYGDDRKQYIYSLILFTLFVENVSLFSQFYVVLWFNRFQNVLKDTGQQVNYTRNEESLHAQIGIKLINTIRDEHPELFDADLAAKVAQETATAFQSECAIIDWMLSGDSGQGHGDESYAADGLSADILKAFIAKRINESMTAIGFDVRLPVDDALVAQTEWFEEELFGNNHVDFFNRRPVDYAKNNKAFDAEELF